MNRFAANLPARRSSSCRRSVGNEPTVGIHVYGGNIGTIRRRSYDPATGEARWFVSGWDSPREACLNCAAAGS